MIDYLFDSFDYFTPECSSVFAQSLGTEGQRDISVYNVAYYGISAAVYKVAYIGRKKTGKIFARRLRS